MRFKPDGLAVFTWETDENGRRIAESEQRHEAEQIGVSKMWAWNLGSYWATKRAFGVPKNRSVVFEIWRVDSRRPSMEFYVREERREVFSRSCPSGRT